MEPNPNYKLNEKFIFTFIPKCPEKFKNRKRFSVGSWSLHKYIGEQNAIKLLTKIIYKRIPQLEGEKAGDKFIKKYRKEGTIIIYAK